MRTKKFFEQGIQQGLRQGLIQTVEMGLTLKFGARGLKLMPMVEKIEDNHQLESIREAIKTAKELKEIKDLLSGRSMRESHGGIDRTP